MADTTFYELLEIGPEATQSEVKTAFRQQALRNHPDQGGNAALFRLIEEAYETLVSPSRRSDYDAKMGIRKPSYAGAGDGNRDYEEDRPTGQWNTSDFGAGAWGNDQHFDQTGTWDAYDGGRWNDREPQPEPPPQYVPAKSPFDGKRVFGRNAKRVAVWGVLGLIAFSLLTGYAILPGATFSDALRILCGVIVAWIFGSFLMRLVGWALGIIGFVQGFAMDAAPSVVGLYLVGGFLLWLAGHWLFTFRKGRWKSTVARVVLGSLPKPMRPDRRWETDW